MIITFEPEDGKSHCEFDPDKGLVTVEIKHEPGFIHVSLKSMKEIAHWVSFLKASGDE